MIFSGNSCCWPLCFLLFTLLFEYIIWEFNLILKAAACLLLPVLLCWYLFHFQIMKLYKQIYLDASGMAFAQGTSSWPFASTNKSCFTLNAHLHFRLAQPLFSLNANSIQLFLSLSELKLHGFVILQRVFPHCPRITFHRSTDFLLCCTKYLFKYNHIRLTSSSSSLLFSIINGKNLSK